MAEHVTDQHTPAKEVNSQRESPNMDHVPESDKNKLEDAGDARNEKQKHTEDPKNDKAEDKNQPDVQNSASSSLSPHKEAENNNGEEEEQAVDKKAETDHGEDKEEDENDPLSPVPTQQQRSEDNQENGSNVTEETSNTYNTDTNTEAENNSGEEEEQAVVKSDESGPYIQKNETSSQGGTPQISDKVETVGPTTQETIEPPDPVDTRSPGGIIGYLSVVMVIVAIVGAAAINHFYQPESPPQIEIWRPTVQFLKEMDKLKTRFPNQRAELWNRSRIHLMRHLQTAHPTEPVSLILTAGVRAEKTLHCLAQGFASAFSSAFNASVLDIDGASKASQDSDEVKLDIDRKLQGAFEGNTPVAIIHRFEELPPGSTLIFYRYCDHENAAYKKTFLIFTVLLGEEKEIPAESHLSAVEEMVDDHLQNKFLSHDHPVSFDRMDLDKYGGLWSRISHLILPVTTEERIGHEGCEYNRT
ncbi:torsin-1A-interacting protein 2-like isoform X2 [Larimichthys crocea]|uniref:torsin-1A-interacting protein 2-like isoform X2 n=1 Tax=Larimichthys crocea TaxID=215358 RepID=UPI000F5D912E|nr:torsin-1A-interacting protein 2-like isoform X2 [Larimichthys crocea]